MAYTNFQNCTANEYKNIVYNEETHNKIKILFNNVELEDADEYCESFEVVSKVIPNGSKIFMLENLVSQEATLVLHNIDTSIIQDQVSISIGTLVSENTYEYVPIGIYNLQEIPTTDNGKTTIKLRDNSVKLDFNYNAKPLIDEHGGTATKLQILQDICTKAGITCNVSSFIGSSDLIGIYDNTITGRQYVAYLAGSAGAIPIITRSGALDFKYLNNLSIIQIPIEIVEQYSNAENFKISRVVYEDAIRKYESGNENYDTLFLDSANPYISSQEQAASIYNIVNNFEINSFKTGRILGNPAIDSYDLIQITDYDGTIFKTFANNTLRYNGKMINTFASEISFERKKENVSLKSGATFKKWAKTEIDNANAQITIQAGQIDEIEQDIQNPTSTKENKYFDLEDALDSPLIDFSMEGQTEQDSTTGKNIVSSYKTSGTTYVEYYIDNTKLTSSMTFSFIPNVSATNAHLYIKNNNGAHTYDKGTFNVVANQRNVVSFTLTQEEITNLQASTSIIQVYRASADWTNPTFSETQLESGSSATDYEEYTGGSPAPSPSYPFDIHNVSGDNTINIQGSNYFDASKINRSDIVVENDGQIIKMPIVESGNGYKSTQVKLSTLCPNLKVGDEVYLYFDRNLGTSYNNFIYFENPYASSWTNGTSKTINQNMLDSNVVLYGNRYSSGETSQCILSNFRIVKNENETFEVFKQQTQTISLGVKNLLTLTDGTFTDDNNLTVTIANGKVTLNGSTNANYLWLNLTNKDYRYGTPNASNKPLWFSSTLIEKGQYSISSSNSNITSLIRVMFTDASAVSSTNLPNTTTKDIANVCIYIASSGTTFDNETFDLQITKGSTPQYVSASPIELNKISTYQDYIYKDNDRWFLHKEYKKYYLKDLTFTPSQIGSTGVYRQLSDETLDDILKPSNNGSTIKLLCSHYENKTANGTYRKEQGISISQGKKIYVYDEVYNTSTGDYNTWVANNNPYFIAQLETPKEIEITDTTLLEQLNNLMTLPLYKNMTHITLTPNDLQPTMKIEYYRDTSINENFVPKEDMTKYYTKVETNAQIQISSSDIMSEVSRVEDKTDKNNEYTSQVERRVTTLQSENQYVIGVLQKIDENGVEKVKTETGFTFDANGLDITKGEGFHSQITDRTLEVNSNNKELIFLGYDNDLKKTVARMDWIESEHATIGVHRTETITKNGQKRTAGFYVGGGN